MKNKFTCKDCEGDGTHNYGEFAGDCPTCKGIGNMMLCVKDKCELLDGTCVELCVGQKSGCDLQVNRPLTEDELEELYRPFVDRLPAQPNIDKFAMIDMEGAINWKLLTYNGQPVTLEPYTEGK